MRLTGVLIIRMLVWPHAAGILLTFIGLFSITVLLSRVRLTGILLTSFRIAVLIGLVTFILTLLIAILICHS